MIRVKLIKPSARRYWLAQWRDPVTELIKTRSTEHTVRRDAERFAARLEDELNNGTYVSQAPSTWKAFCDRYLSEVSDTKRHKTKLKTKSTITAIDKLVSPKMLSSITDPNVISQFASKLRNGRSAATVDGHLRELRKLLHWARRMGMIKVMPHIEFPDFDREMKGRPITTEEFERIVKKIRDREVLTHPKTGKKIPPPIEPEFFEDWEHYLNGLWLSGLRLEESIALHWSDDSAIAVDFSHKRPMFRVQAKSDKGKTFRLLPMTPDFAQFLQKTPAKKRRGFVFNPYTHPQGKDEGSHRPTANHVGRIISALGKRAAIAVNKSKFASAHDYRRAFGVRWCKVVMPKILQELMRHASIQTTMKYYVGSMAEDAAEEVWRAAAQRFGNTFTNTLDSAAPDSPSTATKTPIS